MPKRSAQQAGLDRLDHNSLRERVVKLGCPLRQARNKLLDLISTEKQRRQSPTANDPKDLWRRCVPLLTKETIKPLNLHSIRGHPLYVASKLEQNGLDKFDIEVEWEDAFDGVEFNS